MGGGGRCLEKWRVIFMWRQVLFFLDQNLGWFVSAVGGGSVPIQRPRLSNEPGPVRGCHVPRVPHQPHLGGAPRQRPSGRRRRKWQTILITSRLFHFLSRGVPDSISKGIRPQRFKNGFGRNLLQGRRQINRHELPHEWRTGGQNYGRHQGRESIVLLNWTTKLIEGAFNTINVHGRGLLL